MSLSFRAYRGHKAQHHYQRTQKAECSFCYSSHLIHLFFINLKYICSGVLRFSGCAEMSFGLGTCERFGLPHGGNARLRPEVSADLFLPGPFCRVFHGSSPKGEMLGSAQVLHRCSRCGERIRRAWIEMIFSSPFPGRRELHASRRPFAFLSASGSPSPEERAGSFRFPGQWEVTVRSPSSRFRQTGRLRRSYNRWSC